MPKIIQERYPTLTDDEVEQVRQQLVLSTNMQGAEIQTDSNGKKFIKIANKYIELDKLSINLIDQINPFQRAYEILSKSITPDLLNTVQCVIEEQRSDMTKEEAVLLIKNYLPQYQAEHDNKLPNLADTNPLYKRIAMAIAYVANKKRERQSTIR